MTVPTATQQTFQSVGNREDLTDMIYDISPTETPFASAAAKVKAKAVFHEWQTDALASAAANRNIEGDDSTALTVTPTVRLGNYCQIFKKTISVAGTQEAVDKAGRDSEIAYQLMKRGKELKRDIEFALTRNQASSAGGAATARSLASTESWIADNKTSKGSSAIGTTPGYSSGTVASPTDTTLGGSFNVNDLKDVLARAWTDGGDPQIVLVGPDSKKKISGFTGIATLYRETSATAKGTRIIGAADIFVHDFGEVRIVPSRFCRDQTVQCLDMDFWAVASLRGMTKEKLSKTGDSEKWHLVTELTLESRNEKANSKITDVDGTL
jgi:hypothetical protein